MPSTSRWVRAAAALATVALAGACTSTTPKAARPPVAKQGDTAYIALFSATADLSGVDAITDWGQRGTEVVQRLRDTASAAQAEAIAELERSGADYRSLWISDSLAFLGDDALAQRIKALSGVARVWSEQVPDLETVPPVSAATQPPPRSWALDALNVAEAWQHGYTGAGITIGFIDTGAAYRHPAISDRYRGRSADGQVTNARNWFAPLREFQSEPTDVGRHGTSTVGLAVGTNGVAPQAQWIAAMGCAAEGCPLSSVLSSMQFMVAPTRLDGTDPDPGLRPQIVNNSWVRGEEIEPLVRGSRAFAAAGIFQTFAVGNDGPACGTASPMGERPTFVTVGASVEDGTVASFSSRGPTRDGWLAPEIIAPGEQVWAPVAPDGYARVRGTSFAAPLVAGVAALMLQANPYLVGRPDAVAEMLRMSAHPVLDNACRQRGLVWPNDGAGYGLVDASSAVRLACAPTRTWTACPSPVTRTADAGA